MTDRHRIMTNIFEQRYYKINKFLLSLLGLWPYQSQREKFFRLTFIVLVAATQIPPKIIAAVKLRNDPKVIAESSVPLLMILIFMTKFVNMITLSDKMLLIFRRIEMDWISVAQQPEIHVLRNYAEQGRRLTIAYAVSACFITRVWDSQPIVTRIMEFIKPMNETRPKTFPFPIDYYGLDLDTFYYYILAYEYIGVILCGLIIIVLDTTFMIQVQHACGMFAVVGHRLKRMFTDIIEEYSNYSRHKLDPAFLHLSVCIRKHSEVIKFCETLEAFYTWVFLIIVGLSLATISFVGVQTVMMLNIKPKRAVRYVLSMVGFTGHLLLLSIFSQRLMDHSQRINEYLCQTEWYRTSLATQKLFGVVIMRARVPCRLTAGKIMTMSMENFATVLKTSMSYFTVMQSMQS